MVGAYVFFVVVAGLWGGRCRKTMLLHHFGCVAEPSYYLGVSELLYAKSCNVGLHIVLNAPTIRRISVREYIKALGVNLAGYAGTIFPQDDADEKSRPKWVTILTRADFVPTEDVLDMNHWLPAWFSDQCDDFDKVHGQELKVIDEQLALLVNNVGEDWEAYLRQRKALDHFRELQSKLGEDEHRILTRQVPADGDCGCWSLIALLTACPLKATTSDNQTRLAMMRVRRELSSSWETICEEVAWQQVFDLLLPGGDPPDDPDELKDEKVEAGDEQQLPGENMLSMNTGQDHEHLLKDVPPPKISKHDRLCSTAGLAKPQAPFARSWDSLAGSVRQPEDDPEKDMEKTQGAKSRLVKEKGSKKKDQKDIQKDQEKVEQKTKRGRQKQLSVIKAMGTKNFLYDMGLDYSTWMKCHYDAAACKKTVACPAGGFRSLQEHLLSAKSVESLKCKICCRILINRKFDLVKLQDHLDALIAENETKRSHLGLGVVHIQDVDIEGAAQASVPAGPDGGFASVGPTDFVKVEPSVWTETNLHDPVVDEDDYDDLPLNALCEMPKPVKRRRMAQSDIDLAKAWHRFLTGLGFDERVSVKSQAKLQGHKVWIRKDNARLEPHHFLFSCLWFDLDVGCILCDGEIGEANRKWWVPTQSCWFSNFDVGTLFFLWVISEIEWFLSGRRSARSRSWAPPLPSFLLALLRRSFQCNALSVPTLSASELSWMQSRGTLGRTWNRTWNLEGTRHALKSRRGWWTRKALSTMMARFLGPTLRWQIPKTSQKGEGMAQQRMRLMLRSARALHLRQDLMLASHLCVKSLSCMLHTPK